MTQLPEMVDHWWWRPGWRVGRSFYTWHVTFADQLAVQRLADHYKPVLESVGAVDAIPSRWLHLTLQGVGFTDEVDRGDVERIVAAARRRCADLNPFATSLQDVRVDPEAVFLSVRPQEPLIELRSRIRAAIADVLGVGGVPEAEDGFRGHVSLAYSNSVGPAEPIAAALTQAAADPVEVTIDSVSLIDLNRDRAAYEWSDVATVTW